MSSPTSMAQVFDVQPMAVRRGGVLIRKGVTASAAPFRSITSGRQIAPPEMGDVAAFPQVGRRSRARHGRRRFAAMVKIERSGSPAGWLARALGGALGCVLVGVGGCDFPNTDIFGETQSGASATLHYVATADQIGPVVYRDPLGAISPDGRWLAYTERDRVHVTPASGGAVTVIGPGTNSIRYLTWLPIAAASRSGSVFSIGAVRTGSSTTRPPGNEGCSGRGIPPGTCILGPWTNSPGPRTARRSRE